MSGLLAELSCHSEFPVCFEELHGLGQALAIGICDVDMDLLEELLQQRPGRPGGQGGGCVFRASLSLSLFSFSLSLVPRGRNLTSYKTGALDANELRKSSSVAQATCRSALGHKADSGQPRMDPFHQDKLVRRKCQEVPWLFMGWDVLGKYVLQQWC